MPNLRLARAEGIRQCRDRLQRKRLLQERQPLRKRVLVRVKRVDPSGLDKSGHECIEFVRCIGRGLDGQDVRIEGQALEACHHPGLCACSQFGLRLWLWLWLQFVGEHLDFLDLTADG